MASVHVDRLDHLGLVAWMIKALGLLRMIDARLMPDAQAEITPGEAVAGMLLKGLGCAKRPLSLTPQFFTNQPLARLLRPGGRAAMFNRVTLGRTRDAVDAYGCDLVLSEVALAVWAQASLAPRFQHLDTTSFARSGDDVPERDERAIHIPHGSSKDHRPDLKPAVFELRVSHDGGVPLGRQSWDGQTSETQIFQERAAALMAALASSPRPRSLVADAKRSTEDTAAPLAQRGWITRIPGPRKLVSQVITPALQRDRWHHLDETTRYDGME